MTDIRIEIHARFDETQSTFGAISEVSKTRLEEDGFLVIDYIVTRLPPRYARSGNYPCVPVDEVANAG